MKNTGRNLMKDIKAGRGGSKAGIDYLSVLATSFYRYSKIKLSLNLFTLIEMQEEAKESNVKYIEDVVAKVKEVLRPLSKLDKDNFTGEVSKLKSSILEESIGEVRKVREDITKKMKLLTTFTDGLQIFEYILNRKEAMVNGTVDEFVDIYGLSDELFRYVFSDNDKLLINSKIQTIVAQLPVRMTKNRFLDILCNTLTIYRGGETSALDDFIESVLSQALIDIPEGFDTEYRDLYDIYQTLAAYDYSGITKEDYDRLSGLVEAASVMISNEVTDYLMAIEVINDLLILLYTMSYVKPEFLDDKYEAARRITEGLINSDDVYSTLTDYNSYFVQLEGAQEEAFEELSHLEGNLVMIKDKFDEDETVAEMSKAIDKADLLTSTSLFMDIDAADRESDVVDDVYIAERKIAVVAKFTEKFKGISRDERRSIMAKVLSCIPVFFNTQEEIKEYFEQALSNCGDDSELTACSNILKEMINEN